jgi:hypothetical protein
MIPSTAIYALGYISCESAIDDGARELFEAGFVGVHKISSVEAACSNGRRAWIVLDRKDIKQGNLRRSRTQ